MKKNETRIRKLLIILKRIQARGLSSLLQNCQQNRYAIDLSEI
jgi:hypothetical protein